MIERADTDSNRPAGSSPGALPPSQSPSTPPLPPDVSTLPGWLEPPPEPALFERVIRMRIALSIGLAIPLGFLIFLVGWAGESWLVAAAGVGVYLYILAQFFIFQNPRRKARNAARPPVDPGGA